MTKWIGVIVGLVIVLVLFPVIKTQTTDYNELTINESFVAVEDSVTVEVFTVDNTADAINAVYVNGALLVVTTDYTVSGSAVTLLTTESETDDVVLINYTYTYDTPSGLDAVMVMFSTIILVGVLGWFSYSMFAKYKG